MFGPDLSSSIDHAIRAHAGLKTSLDRIGQDDTLLLGLLAQLQYRLGKSDEDPTQGMLDPYLKSIQTKEPRKVYNPALLARIQYKLDNVVDALALTVYEDDLRKGGSNPAKCKFIIADKDFNAEDDARSRKLLRPAAIAFEEFRQCAVKVVYEVAKEARHLDHGLEPLARQILIEAHKRIYSIQPEAYRYLRDLTLVSYPLSDPRTANKTLAIGISRKAMAGDIEQPNYMAPFGQDEATYASFTGRNAEFELWYSPHFIVNSLYEGVADQILYALTAEAFDRKYPGRLPQGYVDHLATIDSIVDTVAGILIYMSFHVLHGHLSPQAAGYDKVDREVGPVFGNLVNVVGGAIISQEILRTTEIKLMPFGGIIKSWDVEMRISPEKLLNEVVTKVGSFDGDSLDSANKQITDLAKECARVGITELPAVVTFSWPAVRGIDSRLFSLTKLFLRAVSAKPPSADLVPSGDHAQQQGYEQPCKALIYNLKKSSVTPELAGVWT